MPYGRIQCISQKRIQKIQRRIGGKISQGKALGLLCTKTEGAATASMSSVRSRALARPVIMDTSIFFS